MKKLNNIHLFVISTLLAACLAFAISARHDYNELLAADVIRLHILPNSDSYEDQARKLQIRDEVLALLSSQLEGISCRDKIRQIILDNLDNISAIDTYIQAELQPALPFPAMMYGRFFWRKAIMNPCKSALVKGLAIIGGV